jgi:hemin uptake protein HemP
VDEGAASRRIQREGSRAAGVAQGSAERARPRRIDSPALFHGEREVVIIHQGQEYRLRITKADKLILTK